MIKINRERCMYCGGCVGVCPTNALTLNETMLTVSEACNDCGICVKFCPVEALEV
ncbi:MAG: ferredoxin [Thermoplasmata archaeon]|nr:MAG: ferredoxin [Thermoplasmata archaeon]